MENIGVIQERSCDISRQVAQDKNSEKKQECCNFCNTLDGWLFERASFPNFCGYY